MAGSLRCHVCPPLLVAVFSLADTRADRVNSERLLLTLIPRQADSSSRTHHSHELEQTLSDRDATTIITLSLSLTVAVRSVRKTFVFTWASTLSHKNTALNAGHAQRKKDIKSV